MRAAKKLLGLSNSTNVLAISFDVSTLNSEENIGEK
jgi:hypothetical protein